MVSAILLAAGMSTRMGEVNKLLLPIQGIAMVRRVAEQITASNAGETVAVLGYQADAVQAVLSEFPLSFAHNPDFEQGMTRSIQRGVAACRAEATGYMICLSDLPALSTEEYDHLLRAFETQRMSDPACIVMPVFDGQRGNPVIFSAAYQTAILAHGELEGCRAIVQANREHVLLVKMATPHCLHDIDTPEAYRGLS
jgi:molybdenum cofactor cytidylyltransferase